MVEIDQKIIDGDIVCHVNCPQKDICANHESASDMRTEVGPRPKLQLQNKKILCSTFNNDFMKAKFGAVTFTQISK